MGKKEKLIGLKVDSTTVKLFEDDQKAHGTKVAIGNLIWSVAANMLHAIGVKRIKTSYKG